MSTLGQNTRRGFNDDEGPVEVLIRLFHDLGIQSNVLVGCEYSHSKESLSPARIFRVLGQVIREIPELAIILVDQPTKEKKGHHQSWEARLPRIRFRDCVEFVEDASNDKDIALARVIEASQNRWFDTEDTTKPLWRLLVVNGRFAVFVFHHSIGDGMSGYAFHRSFLSALNADYTLTNNNPDAAEVEEGTFEVQEPTYRPIPLALDSLDGNLSWFSILWTFLSWHLFRVLVKPKYLFFSDAIVDKTYPTYTNRFPIAMRTQSRAEMLRIDKDTMNRCLAKCRDHKTTFTALLQTILSVILATEMYPQSKIGLAGISVNIRPLLPSDPGRDAFMNAAATYCRIFFLEKYRAAARDNTAVWKLAADNKEHMNDSIYKTKSVLQDYLKSKLLGQDDEEIGTFRGLQHQNHAFLISNIGVFKPRDDMRDGGWSVTDVAFCAAAVRAALEDYGMVLMVAGVEDGDCVVTASWEEGVLKEEMVKEILRSISGRLKSQSQ